MRTARSRARVLVPAVALASLLIGVAACGPAESTDNASGAGGAGAGGAARDSCLTGTWNVDVQALAQQAASKLAKPGQGTAEGSIKVSFGDAMSIVYANTLTITSNASNGLAVGVRDSYAGTATSTDYRAEGGHLSGSMATNTVTKKTAVVVGTQVAPATDAQLAGVLDLAQGVTSYACSGNTLTLTVSGGLVDWKLTKA